MPRTTRSCSLLATLVLATAVGLASPATADPGPGTVVVRRGDTLRYLLDSTGDTGMAVAAYYQGLNGVRRDGVQPGTAHYVEAVLALRARFG